MITETRRRLADRVAPDVILLFLRIKFRGVEVEIVHDCFELKEKLINWKLTQDLIFK